MRSLSLVWTVALVGCGGGGDDGGGGPAPRDEPAEVAPVEDAARVDRSVPLLGGTLLAAAHSDLAFAADPEGDRLLAFDTAALALLWSVDLPEGSVPFRLAEGEGALFATLRGSASIARIDVATLELTTLASCAEPRGIAWDADNGALWIACASGEIERRDAAGALVSSTWVESDLRDIVPDGDRLLVSRFRSAELLTLDTETLDVVARRSPPGHQGTSAISGVVEVFEARVAWRLVRGVDGDVMMSNQLHQASMLSPGTAPVSTPVYYSDSTSTSCGIVESVLTSFPLDGGEPIRTPPIRDAALPVDIAWNAGAWYLAYGSAAVVGRLDTNAAAGPDICTTLPLVFTAPSVSSLAFDGSGRALVAGQHPFKISVNGVRIPFEDLADPPKRPTAYATFHAHTPTQLACASCHPEGSDDAHVWDFGWDGLRRTQNLAVRLSETAPFHWNGSLGDMATLVDDVMVTRMLGPQLTDEGSEGLLAWIDGLAPVRVTPSGDAASIARGEALFGSEELACTTCHAGDRFTSPENAHIGKTEVLQTPSLIGVGGRGPWMHDGCAATLEQRFLDLECGGYTHGGTVAPADVPDLVAYLETL